MNENMIYVNRILVNNDMKKRKRPFSVFYTWSSASKNLYGLLATAWQKENEIGYGRNWNRKTSLPFFLIYSMLKMACSKFSKTQLNHHTGTNPGHIQVLAGLAWPPCVSHPTVAQDPIATPWGRQSLSQWCHNSACLQCISWLHMDLYNGQPVSWTGTSVLHCSLISGLSDPICLSSWREPLDGPQPWFITSHVRGC